MAQAVLRVMVYSVLIESIIGGWHEKEVFMIGLQNLAASVVKNRASLTLYVVWSSCLFINLWRPVSSQR